jgi:hypothetical protein
MIRPRFQRHRRETTQDDGTTQVEARGLATMFAAPSWLQDLGLVAWFLVGLGLVLVGVIWLLGQTSTIVRRSAPREPASRSPCSCS